ncbi:MAG: NUDIX domain-containing protein [Candidatus Moranbacteria bacterium]|nr:NUDIX domain-containing protein [Candidatus Moranbacteria bacterium]
MPHINELIDYCVETFVVFEDKVLLRYHDKYDMWLSVGGHIELDENPNEAAVREVKEEVGLDVELCDKLLPFKRKDEEYEELIPPFFLKIHKISDTHRHIGMTYFAKSNSDQVIDVGREKSGGWKWMTKEDIENATDIDEEIKFYALRALEELGSGE